MVFGIIQVSFVDDHSDSTLNLKVPPLSIELLWDPEPHLEVTELPLAFLIIWVAILLLISLLFSWALYYGEHVLPDEGYILLAQARNIKDDFIDILFYYIDQGLEAIWSGHYKSRGINCDLGQPVILKGLLIP